MNDLVLAWIPEYGLLVLFAALSLAAIGMPLPGTLLLLAVGSLVSQGELPLWPVIATAIGAAVLGDQVGYAVGRWGGERLVSSIERHDHGGRLAQARALAERWGALGIFLSRWLIGPLGPWVVTGVDYSKLMLRTRLNGKVVREQSTAELIYDIPTMIAFTSKYVTLEPGDLVYTGTPGTTKKMAPGDVVEVDIEGIGVLRNPVKAE